MKYNVLVIKNIHYDITATNKDGKVRVIKSIPIKDWNDYIREKITLDDLPITNSEKTFLKDE